MYREQTDDRSSALEMGRPYFSENIGFWADKSSPEIFSLAGARGLTSYMCQWFEEPHRCTAIFSLDEEIHEDTCCHVHRFCIATLINAYLQIN
jgi:hypothetical protein